MISRRGLLAGLGGIVAGTLVGTAGVAEAASFPKWNRSTVQVWDRLGAGWPVQTAAEAWDDSSKLDVVRVTKPAAGASVITVEFGVLPARVLGQTFVARDGLGRYKSARVVINSTIDARRFDTTRRLALVRHEVGHALGFNHSRTGTDVMQEQILVGGPCGLSDFHRETLRKVYG